MRKIMAKKSFKCPFCENGKRYRELPGLINHIENNHSDKIAKDMTASQVLFNIRNNKTGGKCVICGKPSKWNEPAGRYERFCSEKCKETYKKQFKSRMIDKYGKPHLLNDPNMQKKMLAGRSISGKYKWSNDNIETNYTGSYELDFLKFLDLFMEWNPSDIIAPAPQVFYYDYQGKKHFYFGDFYIPSHNLIIEIKDGGENPNKHHKIQNVDKEKERIKKSNS
jgi:hypothetical protein